EKENVLLLTIFSLLSISATRCFNLPLGVGGGSFRAQRVSQPSTDPDEYKTAEFHNLWVRDVFLESGQSAVCLCPTCWLCSRFSLQLQEYFQ
uniref:Uncharacterized protein n=1 Tax=Kryptolebias marmoratus TaxID=37003 RepID=A0A3Q2ZFJ2_KRYMA